MRALEWTYDKIFHDKLNKEEDNWREVLAQMCNTTELYLGQLVQMRPQRAFKLGKTRSRIERYRNKLTRREFDKDLDYSELIEEIANVHRTGKEIKRQMKQQFQADPQFADLDEVILNNSEIDGRMVMTQLRRL